MKRVWGLLLMLAFACGTSDVQPTVHRVVSTPYPTSAPVLAIEVPTSTEAPVATARATAPPASVAALAVPSTALPLPVRGADAPPPAARTRVAPAPVAPAVGLTAFTSLGSWLDVYDHTNDPKTVLPLVDKMADLGTKTLYLETARMSSATDIQYPQAVGAALDRAKARGMRVVAWYPPDFKDLKRDVKRSVAAVKFRSPGGNRFDAFGADIEYTAGVPDHKKRNAATVEYSKQLRAAVGSSYPLAAIVIPPTWLEIRPERWPDFPWAELAKSYNLFMPMNYWTARGKNPKNAYDLTKTDTEKTQELTGRPVHIIGGLGADADKAQTAAYVKAARDAGSLGGGLYDFTTTRSDVWGELRKLN